MAFELPPLPFEKDALEPHISKETLEYHHGKHHNAYVTKLNDMIKGTDDENRSLEEIIQKAKGGLFNQAAQVWNHTFYWNSLSPNGGGEPSGELGEAITKTFGSFDKFKEEFNAKGAGNFGSGWTWLVKNSDGSLEIVNTDDADTPIAHGKGQVPLFTVDMWEHAYYIDYRNARPNYADRVLKEALNWDWAALNLDGQGVSRTIEGAPYILSSTPGGPSRGAPEFGADQTYVLREILGMSDEDLADCAIAGVFE